MVDIAEARPVAGPYTVAVMVSRSRLISVPVSLRKRLMLEPPVPMIMGIARSFVSETVSMSPSIEATSSLILAAVLAEEVASPTTVMMPPCLSTLTLSAPHSFLIPSTTLSLPSSRTPMTPKRTEGNEILTTSRVLDCRSSFSILTAASLFSFLPVTWMTLSPRGASTLKQLDSLLIFSKGQRPLGSSLGGRIRNRRRLGS
mmetsp:Transcript_7862/g.15096  ORF Transcript_7862/g.15096 Transcript_7862/m.15096 type:complete len:201 (+) Transcript_7862:1044-1646(+)